MKITFKLLLLSMTVLFFSIPDAKAQVPDNIILESDEDTPGPIDDIVEKRTMVEKRVLPYDHIREADIFWEKRIWRVIDVREKMNLRFANPARPFINILLEAAESGEITVYSGETDNFDPETAISPEEVSQIGAETDTITTFNPETYDEETEIVHNELNPEDIKRYRVKEIWFFDEESSTMQVRILGIAPLLDVNDDEGNFLYQLPMFWVYYPEARSLLAREQAFNEGNDASPLSWEDILEMRFFSSYIMKESNVYDRRLEDYLKDGVDLLLEGDKIKNEIFNFEQDLWSY